jgi:hypothetical protein
MHCHHCGKWLDPATLLMATGQGGRRYYACDGCNGWVEFSDDPEDMPEPDHIMVKNGDQWIEYKEE